MIPFVLLLFSILFPVKAWFPPSQPLRIEVKPDDAPVKLVLTDFSGKTADPSAPAEVKAASQVELREIFPILWVPGAYILYAVPVDAEPEAVIAFIGTPLLVEVREVGRPDAPGPTVTRVEALQYARIETDRGTMTAGFYYDVAPNTVANFISLSKDGFYDGLPWYRILPGFVIQSGDPRGDGRGGPGYFIDAEFSDRQHDAGVLSMARNGASDEVPGLAPSQEYANSAGSQFFIALDYKNTWQLDGRYTVFGKVVDGMETVQAIAATPLADANRGRPETMPVIQTIEILPVTRENNPYLKLLLSEAQPTTRPADEAATPEERGATHPSGDRP